MASRDEPTPPILDYSSPGQERRREDDREAERLRLLHNYNESTFGEREPYVLWPFFVILPAVMAACFWLELPRWAVRSALPVAIVVCWNWSRITSAIRSRIERARP